MLKPSTDRAGAIIKRGAGTQPSMALEWCSHHRCTSHHVLWLLCSCLKENNVKRHQAREEISRPRLDQKSVFSIPDLSKAWSIFISLPPTVYWVLSTRCHLNPLVSLNLLTSSLRSVSLSSFYVWIIWDQEKLNNMPKVTQLRSVKFSNWIFLSSRTLGPTQYILLPLIWGLF